MDGLEEIEAYEAPVATRIFEPRPSSPYAKHRRTRLRLADMSPGLPTKCASEDGVESAVTVMLMLALALSGKAGRRCFA